MALDKPKLIRITTVPQSLRGLLKGQLNYMSNNGFEVIGVSSPGEALNDVKKNEGVKTVGIEMTRSITPIQDLKALVQLIQLFRKEKPQIVHTHTPKAGIVGMLGAKLAGVPIRLHTVAGLPLMEEKGIKRKILDFVEKLTYACATKVYPNSKGLYDFILENKFTSTEKLKVIGKGSSNGIDTEEFNPSVVQEITKENLRISLGINKNDFIFLFVGRLVKDKGVNELVNAFQELNKRYKNIHLVLVGRYEDDLDPLQNKTMKSIKTNPNIHAVGYKHNVIDYFGFADVLTFPSYREGFPNVVMQAASMQLNAIVSDINGCNEIIENGVNGWIVDVKNEIALREKMEWCYLNRNESQSMGLKSRNIMQDKFERVNLWKLIKDEYELLIKTKNV